MAQLAVVKPAGTRNLCANPSFEDGTYAGWFAVGGVTTDDAFAGLRCLQLVVDAAYLGTYYSITLDVDTEYTFSAYVRGFAGATFAAYVWDEVGSEQLGARYTFTCEDGEGWRRVWVTTTIQNAGGTIPAGTRAVRFHIECLGESSGVLYIDAVQIEVATASGLPTTYCDGEQPYCAWEGQRHRSASRRSAATLYRKGVRHIGEIVVLGDDAGSEGRLGAYFLSGFGMPEIEDISIAQPLAHGAFYQGTHLPARELSAILYAIGDDYPTLRAVRQALVDLLKPALSRGNDRFTLLYATDAEWRDARVLWLRARYLDGLRDGGGKTGRGGAHAIALRLLAHYPLWRGWHEQRATLSLAAGAVPDISAVAAYVDGAWSSLGGGVRRLGLDDPHVYAIAPDGSGNILVAGQFDSVGTGWFDVRGVARWNGSEWESLGLASNTLDDLAIVYALAVDPASGDIYIGGANLVIDGTDYHGVARYDAAGGTWEQMGQGVVASAPGGAEIVYGLTLTGTTLIVHGAFAGGIAALTGDPYTGFTPSPHVATWDTVAHTWSAINEAPSVADIISNGGFESATAGVPTGYSRAVRVADPDGTPPEGSYVGRSTHDGHTGAREMSRQDSVELGRSYEWTFEAMYRKVYGYQPDPATAPKVRWTVTRKPADATAVFTNPTFSDPPNSPPAGYTAENGATLLVLGGGTCRITPSNDPYSGMSQTATLLPQTTYRWRFPNIYDYSASNTKARWRAAVYDATTGSVIATRRFSGFTQTLIFTTGSGTSYKFIIQKDNDVRTDVQEVQAWQLHLYVEGRETEVLAQGEAEIAQAWQPYTVEFFSGPYRGQELSFPVEFKLDMPAYTVEEGAPPYVVTYQQQAWLYSDDWRCTPGGGGVLDGAVRAVAVGAGGELYIGGAFTVAGGTPLNRVARWTGSRWRPLGTGIPGGYVTLLRYDSLTGRIIASGTWTVADDGAIADAWLAWDGSRWVAVGEAMPDSYGTALLHDGTRYHVAGAFSGAGGQTLTDDGYLTWNGRSEWVPPTLDLPNDSKGGGTLPPRMTALALDGEDIYLGFSASGTAHSGAQTTIDYGGTAVGYPVIEVERRGDVATLVEISNLTTGARLLFAYGLAEGETLTIDCRPDSLTIRSNIYGTRLSALTETSAPDFADFHLAPGENTLIMFATGDLAGLVARLTWHEEHWSADGAG